MPTAPFTQSPHRIWNPLLAAALLVAAAIAAYSNSFSGQLIYDDTPAIKDNPTIVSLWPLSTVLSPPSDSGITVNGRPLVNLSLAINYAIGGIEVGGYHVVNLGIHILAGLTLFGLVRRTLQLPALHKHFRQDSSCVLPALCVALLWTLHPLQTESVTYIVQRAESLVGLFYLLTFYCFVRSTTATNPFTWQLLTVLSCVCGMASKEVMASAPLLVLLYDRAVVSGTFREAWSRRPKFYVALASSWLLLGWLMAGSAGRGGTAGFGAGGISSWNYALTSALALGKYLKLTVWPDPLIFDYGTAIETELLPVLPQGLVIVSLVAATAYALWRRPLLGFLGMWFFAILGPSSSIIPIASEPLAEHRMYLPLVPILAIFVVGVNQLLGRRAIFVFAALAIGAGWQTHRRNEDYRDELTIWRDTQRKYPSNARAHNNVGEIIFRQERRDEAIACFREAVRLLPNYVDALNNLGNSLTQQGNAAESLPHLERALIIKPEYAETHNNLGSAFYSLGRKEEAVVRYREAVRLKPTFADVRNNLGVVLGEQGKNAEAIEHYEVALRLKKDYVDAHFNYGNALREIGRIADAITQFETAIRLKPTHAKAHHNLGSILFNQGQPELAKSHYETALRIKPDYGDAEINLGVVLLVGGRPAEAKAHFEAGLRLMPGNRIAQENLSQIHNILGAQYVQENKLAEAQVQFELAININAANPGAHNNLAVVLWRTGFPQQAIPHFEEALRLSPDFADAKSGLADLKAQLRAPQK